MHRVKSIVDFVRVSIVVLICAYAPRLAVVDLTYADLNAGDLGTTTGDTLRNAANAAANTVCNLYRDYPSGIIPSFGTSPPGQFTDGLMRSLCGPRGTLPDPPVSPFNGGQCVCVSYDVTFVRSTNGGPELTSTNSKLGPIQGVVSEPVPGGDGSTVNFYIVSGSPDCGGVSKSSVIGNVNPSNSYVRITNVVRTDGLPDTCGNLPTDYPDETPPITNYNTNVDVNIGGTTISTPVTIIPTVFAPVNIFRPELNVKVGPINVNLSLGGVTFSPSFEVNAPITLPGKDPRPLPPTPTKPKDPANQEACDLTEVIDLLEDIKDCACEDGTLKSTVYGASEGREITLPVNTKSVLVNVVNVGNGVKLQVGEGEARDVRFLGWCAFGAGGDPGERVPISFVRSHFIAPEGSTHFTYSLNFESTATLTVTYLEKS